MIPEISINGRRLSIWIVAALLLVTLCLESAQKIAYAEPHGSLSREGIFLPVNWQHYGGNPVLTGYSSGPVVHDESGFTMWCGFEDTLYHATSSDGISWEVTNDLPVFQLAPPDSWEDGSLAGWSIIRDADGYKLWYSVEKKPGSSRRVRASVLLRLRTV